MKGWKIIVKKEIFLAATLFTLIVLNAFCSVSFARQGTLNGQVVDGFDKVVTDVEIEIKGTENRTKTDEDGKYSISFDTGKIEILFRKKGYARQRFSLNLREGSNVSLPTVTSWKLPQDGGVFLVRMEDYKKIEYTSFYSERDSKSLNFYTKGSPTKIECSENAFEEGNIELMLLDYSKDEPVVVGKSLYLVKGDNLIGNIVYDTGGWAVKNIDDKYSTVSSRVGLHYVRLEPGKYFYCIGQLTLKTRLGFGYYFEIVAPISAGKKG